MAATVSFATTYVCSPMSSAIRARTSAAGELALGTLLADGVGRAIVLAQPARHTTPAAHAASTLSIRTILPVGRNMFRPWRGTLSGCFSTDRA